MFNSQILLTKCIQINSIKVDLTKFGDLNLLNYEKLCRFFSKGCLLCSKVNQSENRFPKVPFLNSHSSYIKIELLIDVLSSTEKILIHNG